MASSIHPSMAAARVCHCSRAIVRYQGTAGTGGLSAMNRLLPSKATSEIVPGNVRSAGEGGERAREPGEGMWKRALSGHNRNVRNLAPIEMSAVMRLSLFPWATCAPGVILGWTTLGSGAILGRAVGRIGLCGSATRASDGRLYARRSDPRARGRVFLPGIGRPCVKLRGFGGRAPD